MQWDRRAHAPAPAPLGPQLRSAGRRAQPGFCRGRLLSPERRPSEGRLPGFAAAMARRAPSPLRILSLVVSCMVPSAPSDSREASPAQTRPADSGRPRRAHRRGGAWTRRHPRRVVRLMMFDGSDVGRCDSGCRIWCRWACWPACDGRVRDFPASAEIRLRSHTE